MKANEKKSRPAPYTKEEVAEMVKSQTSKTADKFRKLIETVENNPEDMEAWKKLVSDSICTNHNGKMRGMVSISTSCKISCGDNAMRDDPTTICYYCFSDTQQDAQPTTKEKLIRNTYLYAFHDIPAEAFPRINAAFFRLEAFGDLMTAQQFKNYLKLAKANPQTTFSQWTKKPWIMSHVFKTEEKPANLIVILSAPRVNDTMTFQEAKNAWPFIDKLFTVYDKPFISYTGIEINCGGRHCLSCLRCYEHNDVVKLNEQKK